jgi:hypothetical protein
LERDRQRKRSIYFYISYSKLWKEKQSIRFATN